MIKKVLLKLLIVSTIFLYVPSIVISAASKNITTKNAVIDLLAQNEFAGNLLIVKNNHYWLQYQTGYSNYAQKHLNTKHSVYQLASLEKSITATLLMKAQEQHKLNLTDSLHQYFPQIPYSANLNLEHLLRMESGLVLNNTPSTTNLTGAQLDQYLSNQTHFEKDYVNRWHYSDVNYILLARILAKVNHCSYQQLFERFLRKPLKLKNTNVDNYYKMNIHHTTGYNVPKKAANYQFPLKLDKQRLNFELGAGQLYSNVQDFYRLQAAIVRGKVISLSDLQTIRQIKRNNNYNGGVYNDPGNHFFYAHGVEQGFDTVFVMSDDGKQAVVLFSNRHNPFTSNTIAIAQNIYRLVFTSTKK